jgi:hypothetical protein
LIYDDETYERRSTPFSLIVFFAVFVAAPLVWCASCLSSCGTILPVPGGPSQMPEYQRERELEREREREQARAPATFGRPRLPAGATSRPVRRGT